MFMVSDIINLLQCFLSRLFAGAGFFCEKGKRENNDAPFSLSLHHISVLMISIGVNVIRVI